MPLEEDYKMWLEKALIKMNPDWICDGMCDTEFTHDWCSKYCGKDDAYITPKCLHMYYHHIARADRKTEPNLSEIPTSSEKPNNCDTCKHNKLEWFSEVCDGCSKAHSNYEPKDEPLDKDINVRSKDEPQVIMPKKCKGCDSASKIIEAYSRGFEDGAETVKAVAIKALHEDYVEPYVTIEDEPQERSE